MPIHAIAAMGNDYKQLFESRCRQLFGSMRAIAVTKSHIYIAVKNGEMEQLMSDRQLENIKSGKLTERIALLTKEWGGGVILT